MVPYHSYAPPVEYAPPRPIRRMRVVTREVMLVVMVADMRTATTRTSPMVGRATTIRI